MVNRTYNCVISGGDKMTIGERIREERKSCGISMAELGRRIGVTAAAVSRYELGQRELTIDTIERIANALGIHVFDLVGIGSEMDKYRIEISEVSWKNGTPPPEETLKELEKNFSAGPRALYDGLKEDQKQEFWTILMKPLHAQLNEAFDQLNEDGKEIAVQRVQELGKIPEYQREQPETAPQSPPAPPEGTDTTQAPEGTEGPQEGE